MVVRLEGKIDGNPIVFERKDGDRWETTIPANLDGVYVVELVATDEAGNQGYACQYILTVDLSQLCVHLEMIPYRAELDMDDYYVEILTPHCKGGVG